MTHVVENQKLGGDAVGLELAEEGPRMLSGELASRRSRSW